MAEGQDGRDRSDGRSGGTPTASAVLVVLAVLACDPASTRPAFLPLPQADTLLLRGQPGHVAAEAASWLTARGVTLERWSERDGYVETAWWDTSAQRATRGEGDLRRLLTSVKLRAWADPGPPGQTRITVELVYRPFYDPSQPPRDREVSLTERREARSLVDSLLGALKTRLGVPGAGRDSTVDRPATPPSPVPTAPSRPDR